ncbi:MAG: hypothetical protein KY396_07160, partial [Actinobacteria bacterium]|nr:hypothetical protein [Actinomycetota bacterium]
MESVVAAPERVSRTPRGPDEAVGAFVEATRVLLDGGSIENALASTARGAAALVGADLALGRLRMDDGSFVARAVHVWRASLAT